MSKSSSPAASTTTAGSLPEQLANAIPQIVGRAAAGRAGETALGAMITIRAWDATESAALVLASEALKSALDPGAEALVAQTENALARRANLTREAVRDGEVRPRLEPALRDLDNIKARSVSGLRAQNARASIDRLVEGLFERINLLQAQLGGAIEPLYGTELLLRAIEAAIAESDAGLATLVVALERLGRRADSEGERIDNDIAEAGKALAGELETLRMTATETSGASFFQRDHAVSRLIASVQTTVPKLGSGRVSLLYLPLVRKGLPAVTRAIAAAVAQLGERRGAVKAACERLAELDREAAERRRDSGRVLIVGAPSSRAVRDAAIEQLVKAARPAATRRLRDLTVWQAPLSTLVEQVLDAAREAVRAHAATRSLDDALLDGRDPVAVARELDGLLRGLALPVALSPNADRGALAALTCSVLRVAPGSRLPQILLDHAGFRPERFDRTGSPDRLELLIFQPGIDITTTAVFAGGSAAYEDEIADRTAPPIHVLSDATLAKRTRARRERE